MNLFENDKLGEYIMMNLKRNLLIFVLLFVFLMSFQATSVYADTNQSVDYIEEKTVQLRINNKSEGPLRIQLVGPKTYYLNAPIGTTKHAVIPGIYTYSYLAYGTYTEKKLEILKDGTQLTIVSQSIKVQIKNKTGVALTMRLVGPQIKNVSVPPGSVKVDIWKGTYEYSYLAFGIFKNGTVEFQSNGAILELEKLTAKINVDNKSGAQVLLSLAGPRYYNLTLPTGKNKEEVLKGEYTYSYWDHGVYESGKIDIQGEQETITLPNKIATLKIANKSGTDLRISFLGKIPYFLNATAGTSKHVVRRGTYEYSYYACGKWQSGELGITKNAFEFTIPSCNQPTKGSVKVVINNRTYGLLTLHLTGPDEYWVRIYPGTETIQVVKGTYDYVVWGCGDSVSGTKKIASKFQWDFWCQ